MLKALFSSPAGKKILLTMALCCLAAFVMPFVIGKNSVTTLLQIGCCVVISFELKKINVFASIYEKEHKK